MDAMGPIPYCDLNGLLDASLPKGALNYWKAHFLTDLSDESIGTLVSCFEKCPSPMSQIVIEHFHGAATRVRVSRDGVHAQDDRLQRGADLTVERSSRHRRMHGLVPRHLQSPPARSSAPLGT